MTVPPGYANLVDPDDPNWGSVRLRWAEDLHLAAIRRCSPRHLAWVGALIRGCLRSGRLQRPPPMSNTKALAIARVNVQLKIINATKWASTQTPPPLALDHKALARALAGIADPPTRKAWDPNPWKDQADPVLSKDALDLAALISTLSRYGDIPDDLNASCEAFLDHLGDAIASTTNLPDWI